ELVSVVVAVTEMGPAADGSSKPEPRLVVVGNANFVCNWVMAEGSGGDPYFDLFLSSLSWLRERPSNIGVAPKKREYYQIAATASASRLIWLPTILMLVGIVGLAAGVWVVRRR